MRALSTWLLVSAIALCLALLINLLPLTLLRDGGWKPMDWPQLLGLTALPVALALFVVVQRRALNANLRALTHSTPVKVQDLGLSDSELQALGSLAGGRSIEFRLEGDSTRVEDDGARLVSSPRAVWTARATSGARATILVPAIYVARFRGQSAALAALLAHEIAHHVNRDIVLLSTLQRLLRIVAIVTVPLFLLGLTDSIIRDLRNGGDIVAASWASLIGKNYTLVGAATVLTVLAGVFASLTRAREALADTSATEIFGVAALERAERLILGRDGQSGQELDRASAEERDRSRSAFAWDYLLFGAIAAAISDYALGSLNYLVPGAIGPMAATFNAAFRAAGIFGAFLPLYILLLDRLRLSPRGAIDIGSAALLLAVGATLGHFFLQTVPLLLVSTLMPDQYTMVFKHDPAILMRSVLFGTFATASADVLFALAAALGAAIFRSIAAGAAMIVLWVGLSAIESELFPGWLEGWAAIVACIAVIAPPAAAGVVRAWKSAAVGAMTIVLLAPLFAGAAAHWTGRGDINHLAVSSSRAGTNLWRLGSKDGAVAAFERAAWLSSWQVVGWLMLSEAELEKRRLPEAVEAAERAVAAPLTSAWNERATADAMLGQLLLERRQAKDVERARDVLARVEWKWRRSGRLPKNIATGALYNLAAARALLDDDRLEPLLLLLEVIGLDPSMAKASLADPDFASLRLGSVATVAEDYARIKAALSDRPHTVEAFREVVERGAVSREAVVNVLAAVIFVEGQKPHRP